MKRIAVSLVVLLAGSTTVVVASDRPIAVTANSPDDQVHLRLPRPLVKRIGAAPVPPDFDASDSRRGTLLAGIALSGAAVAAGFWLLRYRKRPVHLGKVAATTGATLLLFGCGWWHSWLDDPLPPPQPIPGALCSGRMVIEPVDDGDRIEVLLPKDMAAKVSAKQ